MTIWNSSDFSVVYNKVLEVPFSLSKYLFVKLQNYNNKKSCLEGNQKKFEIFLLLFTNISRNKYRSKYIRIRCRFNAISLKSFPPTITKFWAHQKLYNSLY